MVLVFRIMMFVIPMKIVRRELMNRCVHRVSIDRCCPCCRCLVRFNWTERRNIQSSHQLEFSLHQRTQQENRKKLPKDEENLLEEVLDDLADDEQQAGPSSTTTVRPKTTTIKRKSNSSSFLYNIDLETQDRVSRLQKLKEHLEETKGPEAWYHLFQTLIQHQQQDHSSLDPDLGGSSSSNDDENFKDHLLALEQQWIADRQKSFSTTTTKATMTTKRTTRPTESSSKKSKINSRKSTTTRPVKLIDEDFLEDEEENEAAAFDDDDRYFWQPSYDERRTNRLNSQPKPKTSTRTNKIKSTTIDRENLLLTGRFFFAFISGNEHSSRSKLDIRQNSTNMFYVQSCSIRIWFLLEFHSEKEKSHFFSTRAPYSHWYVDLITEAADWERG